MSRRSLQRFAVGACTMTCLMLTAAPAFGAGVADPAPTPPSNTAAVSGTVGEAAISATTASIGTAAFARRPRRNTVRVRRARDRRAVAHGARNRRHG